MSCEDCVKDARRFGIVTRKLRIEWGVATLQGMLPASSKDVDPDRVRVNVANILNIAQQRASVNGEEWDNLGLAKKMEYVESLSDMWPAESAGPR